MIILVWAMDSKGLIGKQNKLPWHCSEELKYFRSITENKTILMGRKTFSGLINKPLSQRKTIVVTKKADFQFLHDNVEVVNDLDTILHYYYNNKVEDLYVCGGAIIFKQAIPLAKKIYVSIMKNQYVGETYFPSINFDDFILVKKTSYKDFDALIYERKKY